MTTALKIKSNVVAMRSGTMIASSMDDAEFLNVVRLELYDFRMKELAEELGVSSGTLYAFRSGRTKWPRKETLWLILDYLGYELRLIKR